MTIQEDFEEAIKAARAADVEVSAAREAMVRCIAARRGSRGSWGKVLHDRDKAVRVAESTEHVIDVVLTINGVEVSLDAFIMSYSKMFDEEVRKAAFALVKERCENISNALHELEQDVHCAARKLLDVRDGEDRC